LKANTKSKNLKEDKNGYAMAVGGLVALLVAIVVGVLVYWNVSGNMPAMTEQTERFTGYTVATKTGAVWSATGSNASYQNITLNYVPNGASNSSITLVCYNATGGETSAPAVTINNRQITIPASPSNVIGTPLTYSQINVTYTPKIYDDSAYTNTQATTVFNLLPIIAIVVVGGILIGLVVAFGGGGRKR